MNVKIQDFPKPKKITSNLKLIDKIMEFNSEVWKTKKDKNISLNQPIKGIKIPKEVKDFEKDLKVCHGLV